MFVGWGPHTGYHPAQERCRKGRKLSLLPAGPGHSSGYKDSALAL